MNGWRRWLKTKLARRMSSVSGESTSVVGLSENEHIVLHALLQVITNDVAIDASSCRQFIEERILENSGAADAYRRGVRLLEQSSRRHHGRSFSKLSLLKRDRLLHWLFVPYPHEERLPEWVRRVRVIPHKLSLLLEMGDFRTLRHYVMPELLSWYYTTGRGWAVVGWNDFPGKARVEQ